MKDEDELLREQINALFRDEIQEGINDWIDDMDEREKQEEESGLGFAQRTQARRKEGDELKVNVSNDEVDRLIKEYKKIKKNQKSNFGQIKKLGLVDKHGNDLNAQ